MGKTNKDYKKTQHAKDASNNLERIEFVVPVGNKKVLKGLESQLKGGGTLLLRGASINGAVRLGWFIED
ncbi:MAG: hypothetical protein V3W52_17220 [Syntrophobacteria bacterium]